MKRWLYLLLPLLFLTAGCKYNDTEIWNELDAQEARLAPLEALRQEINTNLGALQTLIAATEGNDYVKSITAITGGWVITFTGGGTATLQNGQNGTNGRNGRNGQDGYTPEFGVRLGSDGLYYWTLDGQWLLNAAGERVRASGISGRPADEGGLSGITPLLQIEDGWWMVSTDDGATWTKLHEAAPEAVPAASTVFMSVTTDATHAYFTLADGTVITLPLEAAVNKLQLIIDETAFAGMTAGEQRSVPYEIVAAAGDEIRFTTFEDEGWKVVLLPADTRTGTVKVTAPDPMRSGSILLILTSQTGETFVKTVKISASDGGDEPSPVVNVYTVDATGGALTLPVAATDVSVAAGQDWLSLSEVAAGSVLLNLTANDTYEDRTTVVTVTLADGRVVPIRVTQLQNDAIILSSPTVEISAAAQDVSFVVRANVAYSASSDAAWLTAALTKALEEKTFTLSAEENTGAEARTGAVTFTSEDGAIVQTVTVTQAGRTDTPSDEVLSVTVAEFLAAAPSETQLYRLTGEVTEIKNTTFGNFNLTDETGTVYVYGLTATALGYGAESDRSFSSLGIKQGDTVTLEGYRYTYSGSSGTEVIEVVYAYHISHESGGEAEGSTVAEVLAAPDNAAVSVSNVTVMALTSVGFIVSDGKDLVYVYQREVPAVAIGDKVSVSGTKATYGGLAQIASVTAVETVSTGGSVSYPTAKDITSSFDSYTATTREYITFTGDLTQSGNYYNVKVSGATMVGSIASPHSSLKAANFSGKNVTVTGYYGGITGSSTKYQNIIAVSIKENGGSSGGGGSSSDAYVNPAVTQWLEIPEISAAAQSNCYSHKFELGTTYTRNYSFQWDADNLQAVWVAYPLSAWNTESNISRTNKYAYDPLIPEDQQPNITSGAYKVGNGVTCSRGHQLGSADRLYSKEANWQVFYVTNIAPQIQNKFNGGIWQTLDSKMFDAKVDKCDTLYMITGGVCKGSTTYVLDNSGKKVTIPTAYFKACLCKKTGSGHSGYMAMGIWLEHKEYTSGTDYVASDLSSFKPYAMSINELEQKLGFKLFVNLPSVVGTSTAATIKAEDPTTVDWWWE